MCVVQGAGPSVAGAEAVGAASLCRHQVQACIRQGHKGDEGAHPPHQVNGRDHFVPAPWGISASRLIYMRAPNCPSKRGFSRIAFSKKFMI